jgi:hypothetical protein
MQPTRGNRLDEKFIDASVARLNYAPRIGMSDHHDELGLGMPAFVGLANLLDECDRVDRACISVDQAEVGLEFADDLLRKAGVGAFSELADTQGIHRLADHPAHVAVRVDDADFQACQRGHSSNSPGLNFSGRGNPLQPAP